MASFTPAPAAARRGEAPAYRSTQRAPKAARAARTLWRWQVSRKVVGRRRTFPGPAARRGRAPAARRAAAAARVEQPGRSAPGRVPRRRGGRRRGWPGVGRCGGGRARWLSRPTRASEARSRPARPASAAWGRRSAASSPRRAPGPASRGAGRGRRLEHLLGRGAGKGVREPVAGGVELSPGTGRGGDVEPAQVGGRAARRRRLAARTLKPLGAGQRSTSAPDPQLRCRTGPDAAVAGTGRATATFATGRLLGPRHQPACRAHVRARYGLPTSAAAEPIAFDRYDDARRLLRFEYGGPELEVRSVTITARSAT